MTLSPGRNYQPLLVALALAVLMVLLAAAVRAGDSKIDVLQIGTSGHLSAEKDPSKEKGALKTLQDFIKEQTGLNNNIANEKDWRELADKMAKKEIHVGVFQGYEFAWAQEKYPELKPLALAVNVARYPVAFVVGRKDGDLKGVADLKGKTVTQPDIGQPYLRLYLEQAAGKDVKVATHPNVEDCLDDVVDGKAQAAVVDRGGLEAYKRRKPGRFNQLKELAKSEPFPPVVLAVYGKVIDDVTLTRFRTGLLGAGKLEKGKTVMTLFRINSFELPPDDFTKVLEQTRKSYPPAKTEE